VAAHAAESDLALQPELAFAASAADAPAMRDERGAEAGRQAELPLAPWIAALVMLLAFLEWGVYQRGDSI
jgi:hypothetical protein